ncbi:two-component system, NarL family, sensor histidine kinase UhpB [Gallionellaceae bacterium]|nr:two-component system, NarL family, sensor histidine kinase UhpB [Gallionellaceae bacterium]
MTAKKLNILLVEASAGDARHTLAKLEQSGYRVEHKRVESASAMQAALKDKNWDVVLCSYDPPGFGGLEALKLMHSAKIDLPFLFLSHDLREENIIHAMHSGADDYIFKGSLDRLAPAIEHNLREARIRREHRHAQLALQENQARLHAFIANLPGMAFLLLLDAHDAMSFPYVSEGSQALLGLNAPDLEQNPHLFLNLLHPDDRASYDLSMRTSAKNLSFWNWEGRISMPPVGETKWINLRCSPHKLANGNVQWEGIMSNITQSKQAEIEIKISQEQLRELSSHIQDVREQERLNIAREVHDDLGSTLTAIKLDIAWLGGRLNTQNPDLAAKAKVIEVLVDKCAAAASNISRSLRPSVLDSFGIIAAIEIEAEEFQRRTGIPCTINHANDGTAPDQDTAMDPDTSIALFRIFQEALNNVIKHAQASQVTVDIYNHADGVELIVSDNGRGLTEADRSKPRSFGLRGIRERVAHFGGDVRISSTPGHGTTVAVHIPRTPAHPATRSLLS